MTFGPFLIGFLLILGWSSTFQLKSKPEYQGKTLTCSVEQKGLDTNLSNKRTLNFDLVSLLSVYLQLQDLDVSSFLQDTDAETEIPSETVQDSTIFSGGEIAGIVIAVLVCQGFILLSVYFICPASFKRCCRKQGNSFSGYFGILKSFSTTFNGVRLWSIGRRCGERNQ